MKITIGNFEIYPDMIPTIDRVMNNPISVPINDLLTLEDILHTGDIIGKDLERMHRGFELAEEQVFFAQTTIERMEEAIKRYDNKGGAVKLKKIPSDILSDSMFER